ncbi:nuclear transport factor 2 family protein [Parvibaculum sp.]|uniref:nuclear transport factor 2 family protein n=1 Tax=Parvibaculum sp. TaxID=2024848 RepID=UPI0034A09779
MNTDANKALVVELYERVIGEGDIALADRLLAPGYIQHNPNVPGGRDGFKQYFSAIHARFRIDVDILSVVAEGDMVVIHVEQKVRSRLFSLTIVAMDRFRVENGQIAEHWDVMSGKSFFDRLMLEIAG